MPLLLNTQAATLSLYVDESCLSEFLGLMFILTVYFRVSVTTSH